MSLRPTIEELNLTFLKFACKDFNGSVSFIWANQEVEFKYYSYELPNLLEERLGLRRPPKLYRGSSLDRLKYVIEHGTTNDIPNQGFWANSCLSKALEFMGLLEIRSAGTAAHVEE